MFRILLRLLLTSLQSLRRSAWFLTRPDVVGVHAIPVTPAGRIVLVKLRYASGWRLPGGGLDAREDPEAGILRELREEIGLEAYGAIERLGSGQELVDFRRDTAFLFLVRDVRYRPRWSIEVEDVTEADPDALPPDTSPRTLRWLASARPQL